MMRRQLKEGLFHDGILYPNDRRKNDHPINRNVGFIEPTCPRRSIAENRLLRSRIELLYRDSASYGTLGCCIVDLDRRRLRGNGCATLRAKKAAFLSRHRSAPMRSHERICP